MEPDTNSDNQPPGWRFALATIVGLAGLICVIALIVVTIASFI